jgi:hypothetical protein
VQGWLLNDPASDVSVNHQTRIDRRVSDRLCSDRRRVVAGYVSGYQQFMDDRAASV